MDNVINIQNMSILGCVIFLIVLKTLITIKSLEDYTLRKNKWFMNKLVGSKTRWAIFYILLNVFILGILFSFIAFKT